MKKNYAIVLAISCAAVFIAASGIVAVRIISSFHNNPQLASNVPMLYESEERIIYTTDTSLDSEQFRRDCEERRGTFNTCGRSCPALSEVCAEVCAYTCEFRTLKTISVPDQCASEPKFDDFPVSQIYRGQAAPVDFSSAPEAAEFRTIISAAAAKGPNFAGRYAVAEWGCGTSCQNHAIVEAETGKIVHFGLPSFYGLDYRLNSNLLAVNPASNLGDDFEQVITTDYYVMQDNSLNFSCRLPNFKPGILL